MGLIVVLLIIAGVVWKHSILTTICLILLSSVIIIKKHFQKWVFIFITAFFISLYFYSTNDFRRESLPFDFDPNTSGKSDVRFSDDLKIDGNLLMGSFKMKSDNYQFLYKISNEAEKIHLEKLNLSFYYCSAQFSRQHVLPNTNFSGFHYDAFLYHTYKKGNVKISSIDWQNCQKSNLNIVERIQDYRKNIALLMNQSDILHKGYLIALTLGDTSYLNKEEMNILKTLGIYHLYAISGSHVALISVQLYSVMRRLNIPLVLCKSLLFILLPMYLFFTGGQPSVFRSTIFILLILFNPARQTQMIDLLSLTLIINILYDPFAIFDIGFQLSYIICFSFILILPLYKERSTIFQFFLINIISQFVTIPILFYHFNNNYFIGIITNIFYIPLFTLIIFPLCTLALIMFMLSYKMMWLINLVNFSFMINDVLTAQFMQMSRFEMVIGQQHMLLYFLLFAILIYLFSKKNLLRYLGVILLIIIAIFSAKDNKDIVHFIDVGQGDAFILELGKKTIMIDTGGKLEFSKPWEKRQDAQSISDKTTIPFLKHRGISKINTLILTHPDADHFGETENLIKAEMIDRILLDAKAHGSEKYQNVINLAKANGIELIDVNQYLNNDKKQLNNYMNVNNKATLEFLNVGDTGEENDDSIVVFLKYHQPGRNILFLADLGKEYEDEIINQILEPIDIVKIGHHGSKTSTSKALLKRDPKIGIISAGRKNRYSHPHRETVEALQHEGIKILNTQKDGRISIDLENGMVETQYQSIFLNK
ncbi:DNA internalization-related competence protein ComEC/Rec2 [Macrococcus animalis]|uniref:DNA internalization-related competence protein ComEC/Rec2 n=1 Tax=Macrococcus animalis TaxID=3395467 RepID=UPI0039BE938C